MLNDIVIFTNELGEMYDVLDTVHLNFSFIRNSKQLIFYILNFKSSISAKCHAKPKNNYVESKHS